MTGPLMGSVVLPLLLGWVICVNARDRKTFEKELDAYLADDSGE